MAKTAELSRVCVDGRRLYRSLAELARVGAYRDEATALRGVNRLALTEADGRGRRLVVGWFRRAGLHVAVDRIGNVYARREGAEPALAPVLFGSHIDSVPTAGAFDGCLGVLGALEVVRTLGENRIRTRRPLVIGFFTEEEGCRFGTDMLGSAVATGRIPLAKAYALRDRAGLAVVDELRKIGFLGPRDVRAVRPHAYVECHIEQGPILRRRGAEIGVVSGVQAISWREVLFEGRAAHAGTTPMDLRADAGLAAARLMVEVRRLAESDGRGAGLRGTVGSLRLEPNMVNVVGGRATCTVDLRHPSDARLAGAERRLDSFLRRLGRQDGVGVTWRQTARTPYVPFDERVQAAVARAADRLGLRAEAIVSGAGHDAQEWSRLCKTAMIFVPGEYDGISHNPRELSTPKQCADGANVLLEVVRELAEEP
ncbi:MAG: Zn-dependent hydrolase [Elusimicrobia bacterium]|nr:Zn-dependent hydrolase [Elusimicrobiota bacterium]